MASTKILQCPHSLVIVKNLKYKSSQELIIAIKGDKTTETANVTEIVVRTTMALNILRLRQKNLLYKLTYLHHFSVSF